MRQLFFSFLILVSCLSFGQSLPISFESGWSTSDFINFDGGTGTVEANPQSSGINTSANVGKVVRDGGAIWSGSKIDLTNNLNFNVNSTITMMVYTTAPVGTVVKLKLEGTGSTERDRQTTVSGEWEKLSFDFTGEPTSFNSVVFMFDFGNVGDGGVNSTFYLDNVEQVFSGQQLDLPVNFEDNAVNYTTTDFGGTQTTKLADPENANNTCVRFVKPVGAATWAGTTIGTPAGFASDIPLTLTSSKMYVRVWSPDAGIPVRLKVEDSDDPTHTCETQVNTTQANSWEMLEFDFTNQATGTESLSVGLSMGWTYNMASIFFNFDTDGSTAGEKTYYFDDISFGAPLSAVDVIAENKFDVYPNPAHHEWTINLTDNFHGQAELVASNGQVLRTFDVNAKHLVIDASDLLSGVYFVRIQNDATATFIRLMKN